MKLQPMNEREHVGKKQCKHETGLRMTLTPQQMNSMHHLITIRNCFGMKSFINRSTPMELFEFYFKEELYKWVVKETNNYMSLKKEYF